MNVVREGEVAQRVAEWEAAREAENRLLRQKLAALTTTSPPGPTAALSPIASSDSPSSKGGQRGVVHSSPVVLRTAANMRSASLSGDINVLSKDGSLSDQTQSSSSPALVPAVAAVSPPPAAMPSSQAAGSHHCNPLHGHVHIADAVSVEGSEWQSFDGNSGGFPMPSAAAGLAAGLPPPLANTPGHRRAGNEDARVAAQHQPHHQQQVSSRRDAADSSSTDRRIAQLERQMDAMRLLVLNTVDENRFLRLEVDVLREALLSDDREARERALQSMEIIGRRAGTRELRDSVCTHCLSRTRCFACYACRSVEYCSARCQMEGFASHVALCRHIVERTI